jgi:hypothetical protein
VTSRSDSRVRGQLVWVPADASPDEIEAALEAREARAAATAAVAAALPASFVHDDPRPLLLADVDGVVCPYADELADPAAAGLAQATAGYTPVWLSADIRQHLARLAKLYQLVWCTAWEDRAAQFLAPLLGLPPMPVIRFADPAADDGHWKWPAIETFVGDRAFAWIDGAYRLNAAHVEQLEGFAEKVRASVRAPRARP